jgi:uncharacterized OB-fold protein
LISFNPVLFTLDGEDGGPQLLGSKCGKCGTFFFPQQKLCTACFKEDSLQEHTLSRQGVLYSFTTVERESLAPKGFTVPYAYGYVDLPEGVRILAKIVGWTPETLKIGAKVEMVTEEIRKNSEGQPVLGYRFKVA